MIYESQYMASTIAADGSIRSDMTLLYPSPTVYAKHTLVPLTPRGDAVGRLLTTDPVLQRIAVRHGFRTADAARQAGNSARFGVAPPPQLADVIEPPSQGISERMIARIEQRYQDGPR